MKKLLVYALIFAMVLSLCAPAMAEEYASLVLDEAVSVTVDGGSPRRFAFVPQEDGGYLFCSFDLEGDAYGRILDADFCTLSEDDDGAGDGNFSVVAILEAGELYYLEADTYSGIASYQCTVSKLPPATGMTLSETEYTGYVGNEFTLYPRFIPDNSAPENVTWTSSDDTVATVDDWGWVYFHSVGNATITATSERGLKATCTVTVKDYLVLECSVPVELDPLDGDAWFRFIPKTSGWYSFRTRSEEYERVIVRGILFDQHWNSLGSAESGSENGGFQLSAQLTAGEVYYLQCWPQSYSNTATFCLQVEPAELCQGLTLSQQTITAWPREYIQLSYSLSPLPCATGALTWSSSDETVAQVDPWGSVRLLAPGTATVTLSTESGLSDSCTIIVREPIPLISHAGVQADPVREKCLLSFTPEQDGAYGLWVTGAAGTLDGFAYLYDVDGSFGSFSSSQCAFWDMEAGKTYTLEVSPHQQTETGYQVWIAPVCEASRMSITQSQIHGYPGKSKSISVSFYPKPALTEKVTWSSSDESIVTISEGGELEFRSPGIAMITAVSASGLTDSCRVISYDPPEISLEQGATISNLQQAPVKFVPPESGFYSFTTDSEETYMWAEVYDEKGAFLIWEWNSENTEPSKNIVLNRYFEAGKSYYICTGFYADFNITYHLQVQKSLAPTAIIPKSDVYSVYVGDCFTPEVSFYPENAGKEWVTWSTEDTELLSGVDPFGDVVARKGGTATMTAVSESGLTATIQVHILPIPEAPGVNYKTYGSCGPDLLWVQDQEGTVTITGSGKMEEWGGFQENSRIRQVLFRASITGIEKRNFYRCKNLTDITIPATVTGIGDEAFCGCKKLQTVRFLGSAPQIGEDAFGDVTATVYYPAGDPSWTEAVRQSYGGELTWVAYDPDAGVRVGGSAPEGAALVLTRADNGQTVANVTAQSGAYALEGVLPGEYVLTASKENYVTRSWAVSVGLEEVQLDAVICLRGDVSGDGRINVGDVARIYAHAKKTTLLTDDYQLSCADVSGDGRINVGDAARVYAYAKKTTSLW